MRNFIQGVGDCLRAISFVFRNGLWWAYLVPIVFSIVMMSTLFKLSDDIVNTIASPLIDWFNLETPGNTPDPLWERITYWTKVITEYAIYGVLYLASYLIYFKIQKYIILIFMAPLIAYLSERTEEIVMGTSYKFKWKLFVKDTWRGVRIAVKNLVLELVLIGLMGLVVSILSSFIPLIAAFAVPLSAFLVFLISAYYYGYSSFDYLNERKRLNISEGNRLIWDYKSLVVGNGSVFAFLISIPFIGVIIAPVICPVGAVLSAHSLNIYENKKAI